MGRHEDTGGNCSSPASGVPARHWRQAPRLRSRKAASGTPGAARLRSGSRQWHPPTGSSASRVPGSITPQYLPDIPGPVRGGHRAERVGEKLAGLRTPSTPRGSASTSRRSRPTPAVPAADEQARTWTTSRACRRRSPIEQRTGAMNPRSTVATTTEIYDYLRLLMALGGRAALLGLRAADRPAVAATDCRMR